MKSTGTNADDVLIITYNYIQLCGIIIIIYVVEDFSFGVKFYYLEILFRSAGDEFNTY